MSKVQSNLGKIPKILISWNLFDAILHIAVDMAEVYRISGNVVAILVAVVLSQGLAKRFTSPMLYSAVLATIALNSVHLTKHDLVALMLLFVGVSVYCLLRWAQIIAINEKVSLLKDTLQKTWFTISATIASVLIVALFGV